MQSQTKKVTKRRRRTEKFDYDRWADYYCAAEEGTGGQKRERKQEERGT